MNEYGVIMRFGDECRPFLSDTGRLCCGGGIVQWKDGTRSAVDPFKSTWSLPLHRDLPYEMVLCEVDYGSGPRMAIMTINDAHTCLCRSIRLVRLCELSNKRGVVDIRDGRGEMKSTPDYWTLSNGLTVTTKRDSWTDPYGREGEMNNHVCFGDSCLVCYVNGLKVTDEKSRAAVLALEEWIERRADPALSPAEVAVHAKQREQNKSISKGYGVVPGSHHKHLVNLAETVEYGVVPTIFRGRIDWLEKNGLMVRKPKTAVGQEKRDEITAEMSSVLLEAICVVKKAIV